jgi:hypothetical protein
LQSLAWIQSGFAQEVAPDSSLNVPEGHGWHGELPFMFLYSPGLQETQAVPFDVSPLGHCTQFTLLPSENALWKPSTHLHACPAGPFLTVVLMSSERSGHE